MSIVNTALTLKDLPPPPPGKRGWPWTEQTEPVSEQMPNGSALPRIGIVTPSYNQGQFIEETIRSVLLQGYPNLEYIIIDGGSTDNSVEIIKKYEEYLAYWVSEPDRGQSHAINKGFERCTGDYIAWMNSSDCYMPGALQHLFKKIKVNEFNFIFGNSAYGGNSLSEKQVSYSRGIKSFNLKYLLRFFYGVEYIIPSQSVFVARSFLEKVGLLDENIHYCMDLDWYARISIKKPSIYMNQKPICFYRFHNDAKTICNGNAPKEEVIEITQRYAAYLPQIEQKRLYRLMQYSQIYEEYQSNARRKNISNLVETVLTLPWESLTDRRFLGMLKTVLFYI